MTPPLRAASEPSGTESVPPAAPSAPRLAEGQEFLTSLTADLTALLDQRRPLWLRLPPPGDGAIAPPPVG